MQERRAHERRSAFVAVAIEDERPERRWVALTKDVSRGGVLLLTQARLRQGQDIRLHVVRASGRQTLSGKVVRQSDLAPGGVWRRQVAVELDPCMSEPLGAADAESSSEILFGYG